MFKAKNGGSNPFFIQACFSDYLMPGRRAEVVVVAYYMQVIELGDARETLVNLQHRVLFPH
jgi:hypothetical protein